MRSRALFGVVVLSALALALAGCQAGGAGADAGSGGADAGGADAGASGGGGAAADGLDCSGVTTAGYDLFVDPRLTIDPVLDVYPLQAEGDVVSFTDTGAGDEFTTYAYELSYLDDAGTAFPNDAAIFVGAESTGTFELTGPFAPSGVDGGPYAGIVTIQATTDAGTTDLANICVLLATED